MVFERKLNGEGVEVQKNAGLSGEARTRYCFGRSVPLRMNGSVGVRDTRFARRASRESDRLSGFGPGVALSESGNPGLISSTPSASPACRASRGENFMIEIHECRFPNDTLTATWSMVLALGYSAAIILSCRQRT